MSLQTVINCPAKLYTLQSFSHNISRRQKQDLPTKLFPTVCFVKMTDVSQRLECDNVTEMRHGVDFESTVLLLNR